ncbi:LacI family transcriptional regulator [Bacillus oleivorans]|uniref:Catabolite control protein A n=1 Tax=Bacillus oleivorans TaxID=1448271 RepID=A0A285CJH3_9BACI|nr:LacI family DNA-binding transcriptional regulator [Bacillus oleivorans]SNX67143.1 LacI family transcriptional regulator [Bacillus oleivorans]
MTTIRDVAKQAEVSVATVSRVINKRGYVHEETLKKVEQAIKELNYKPNDVARSLFKKTSNSIGFIIPDITNPFFPQLVRAVESTMIESGYTVILFNSDEVLDHELKLIELMESKYMDGLLVVSNTITKDHLENLTMPVVAIDRVLDKGIPTVYVDNYKGARQAVQFLIKKGCQKIAYLHGPEKIFTAKERLRGYQDEMEKNGLPTFIYPGNYELKASMMSTIRLLAEHPDVDGIFAGNDVMAVGAIKAASKMGYTIPKELKIIGFDGIDLATAITPELTTMHQPILEIGKKGSELLLQLIAGQSPEKKHYVYDAELVERNST